jgi:hypothetical protein
MMSRDLPRVNWVDTKNLRKIAKEFLLRHKWRRPNPLGLQLSRDRGFRVSAGPH